MNDTQFLAHCLKEVIEYGRISPDSVERLDKVAEKGSQSDAFEDLAVDINDHDERIEELETAVAELKGTKASKATKSASKSSDK